MAMAMAQGVTLHNLVSGQRFNCEVAAPSATIGEWKHGAIARASGVPGARQRLLFQGQELQDSQIVGEVGIGDGALLQLVPRMDQTQPPFGVAPGYAYAGSVAFGPPSIVVDVPSFNPAPVNPQAAERMQEAYSLAKWVKIFAFIDFVFLIYWSLFAWPFILGAALAAAGWMGARYYSASLILLYLLYVMAAIALRVWWIIRSQDVAFQVITVLGIVVELYISYLIIRLLNVLTAMSEAERFELRMGWLRDPGLFATAQPMPPPVFIPYQAPLYQPPAQVPMAYAQPMSMPSAASPAPAPDAANPSQGFRMATAASPATSPPATSASSSSSSSSSFSSSAAAPAAAVV